MRTLVCTLALAIFAVGCARSGDSTHKEMAAIQQELGRMRAENAIMMARIEALEAGRTSHAPAAPASKTTPTNEDDRPKLDVLRLEPTPETSIKTDKPNVADETNGEVEPDEPRPVIRSTSRGEVIAQSPRPTKPAPPTRPTTTAAGTPR